MADLWNVCCDFQFFKTVRNSNLILQNMEPIHLLFFLSESLNPFIYLGWEDPEYRKCFTKILEGNWEEHNAFDATRRISANMDMYNCSGTI